MASLASNEANDESPCTSRASSPRAPARDTTSGVVLVLGSLGIVVMMAFHPHSLAHHGGDLFAEAARLATPIRVVHGSAVALFVLLVFGHLGLAQRLGFEHALVRLGLVTYAFGALGGIGGALVNGFAFPAMASHFAGANEAQTEAAKIALFYGGALHHALAGSGVVALSVGVFAWSLFLVHLSGAWRWIGVFGLAVGAVAATLFLSGTMQLSVHDFGMFVLAQALWSGAVGVRLATARG